MSVPDLKPWRTLGDRLRRARLEQGLTQRELAAKLGWPSAQRVSNVERGTGNVSSKAIIDYCRVVELTETREIQNLLLVSVEEKLNQLFAEEPDRHLTP